ncbi:Fe(3+)-hydroxamate ABC transporter permease FhuB [Neorhizobium sp. NCHU2750]|uniref:Fe(3+)-hydroxamate ABC transporter permease FhuB n=1 Tax=Neorhizobium sp. NCHU2750 TaxID=1825976 RepID=UPI000E76FAE2|nr:iron ABC transporter permease [Neorhizobium sp. NCHU2750]
MIRSPFKPESRSLGPMRLSVVLGTLALLLSAFYLSHILPLQHVGDALFAPDPADTAALVFHFSWLPRLCMALICGAGLSVAGATFQQVLRNPIAEPTTLGVSAGAQLALTVATLFAPSLLVGGTEWVALGGASITIALIALLAWRMTISPTVLIVGGLMVTLYAGTLNALLSLLYSDDLGSVAIWSTGSLNQNDWKAVDYLLPRISTCVGVLLALMRPLSIAGLDDAHARSLGLPMGTIRLLSMISAMALSAFVVSSVGVIGFIGLVAPALARLSGARRFASQFIWSAIIGALLLWTTDQLAQIASTTGWRVATGTATAVLGAPILLLLLTRVKSSEAQVKSEVQRRSGRPLLALGIVSLVLFAATFPAVDLAQGPDGWAFESIGAATMFLPLRLPHVVAALSAGAMLAVAGGLMQRLIGNPMASPEILGISSGAAAAALLSLFIVPVDSSSMMIAAGLGALLTLIAILAIGYRNGLPPQRFLLVGIALNAGVGAFSSLLIASNDPRLRPAMSFLAGSTYAVDGARAFMAAGILVSILLALAAAVRWLNALPLGKGAMQSIGMNVFRVRAAIVIFSAVLTGAATVIVGPLSFVGLMAPHLTRLMGLQRPTDYLIGSAILGALIMLVADWLGRNILFPSQVPAGLLAAFVGGPYFLWLVRRKA